MHECDKIIDTYGDMLYRVCLVQLQNKADAEDAVQETFLKYIKHRPRLTDEEHLKAWLIKVAINQSRDIHRRNRLRASESIDQLSDFLIHNDNIDENDGLAIRCLMLLPEKFSRVMILHFVEGMGYKDISKIIGRTESAVKMRIKKGRKLFCEIYYKEIGRK